MVQKDLRFQTLLNLVFSRLHELQFDYVVSIVWSLGICVSAYELEIQPDNKLRLLTVLNTLLDGEMGMPGFQYPNIPSLVFSITCFFSQEDMNELVTDTVERLSKLYGRERPLYA